MTIVLNSNSSNYEIDDYKLNMYENIKSYSYTHCIPELRLEFNNNDYIHTCNKEYYYIFDCPGEDAFAHWVYESFIFIPIFFKIRDKFPNINILTKNTKKYVNNFFKFYKIENNIKNNIDNLNNICFFSPIVSLNDNNINKEFFIKHIDLFCDNIHKHINIYNKNENVVFLPRNTKDNYAGNDRNNLGNNDICNNIQNIGGTVINTYELNNIELQFSKINSFNTIILDVGSSLLVNGIFLNNKKIIVLNNYCIYAQKSIFVSMNILFNYIEKKNNVIFVNPSRDNIIDFNDIKIHL
jgi:hypothetical protein